MKKIFKNEKEIYEFWKKNGFFKSDPSSRKPKYSLLIPPPNLTGELHLGHAMQHSILDAVARFKRLCDFDVLLLPGVDHAGILFEATLERALAKENLSKQKLGRERWLERAWQFKDEIYKKVSSGWRFMGLSADWDREVFTLDDGPRQTVFYQFKTFWEKGLIYKGPYIVQWCPKDQTAIEDVEMEYEERKEKLYFIKYRVDETDESITIATTRPETIAADVAVAIYPKHPRYKKYIGRKVRNPFTGTFIPVIEDKRVQKEFGTGALKITPGHDLLDYAIGKDHHLPILQVISKEGKVTNLDPKLSGLRVLEARAKAAEILGKAIEKIEEYEHSVAVCERCKSVVEPLISEEWFVKMDDLAKGAIKVIRDGKINFLPKNYARVLTDWLDDIHDWCISRSLWWGHRIPVWYPSTSLRTSPSTSLRTSPSTSLGTSSSTPSARLGQAADIRVSLESPGDGWVQDEQVLDTWFSSGLWPLSTLGWPDGKNPKSGLLDRYFPWDFELSAPEIKFLWIARMIMLAVFHTGQIPFKTMFFHGMLRDLQGRKFSKSLGNGIEPTYLIEKWGVDATRMTLYTYSIPGRDGRVSKEILDERGKNFRNFGTKIRNIARFIYELRSEGTAPYQNKFGTGQESTRGDKDDQWILSELEKAVKKVTKNLDSLELHLAVEEIYNFVWHEFADKYIESSKKRRSDAQPTLEHVFKSILILLHPFMPFLTEEIYQRYVNRQKSIMLESWPSAKD